MLFCLTENGSARMLDADRNRLQQLQIRSQQSADANTQVDIAYEVIGIYDKYKGQGDRMCWERLNWIHKSMILKEKLWSLMECQPKEEFGVFWEQ